MNEQSVNIATLNVIQPVLKAVLLSIVGATKADPAKVATFLEGFVQSVPGLDTRSTAMLQDLAAGMAAFSDDPRH